jgi:hypothetical protein
VKKFAAHSAVTLFQNLKTKDIMFTAKIMFSDEATSSLFTHGNRHNVAMWGSNNPQAVIKRTTYNPNSNVFCAQILTRNFPTFLHLPKAL